MKKLVLTILTVFCFVTLFAGDLYSDLQNLYNQGISQKLSSDILLNAIKNLLDNYSGPNPPVSSKMMSLEKSIFERNEEITITYTGGQYDYSAWIGIVPSEIKHGSETDNDQHETVYIYIRDIKNGKITFKVPDIPGSYDLRVNDSDSNGKEVDYLTFTVKPRTTPFFTVDKTIANPGDKITVSYKTSIAFEKDWIGLYYADKPNTQYISYQHTNGKKEGTFVFELPKETGIFELKFLENNTYDKLITKSIQIKVTADSKIILSRNTAAKGEILNINFSGAYRYIKDWIAIYKYDEPGTANYISYMYLNGQKEGTLKFQLPLTPGKYVFKMMINDTYDRLAAVSDILEIK